MMIDGKAPTAELARNFVRTQHRVETILDAHAPPVILKVYRASASELVRAADAPGRVEVWFPKE